MGPMRFTYHWPLCKHRDGGNAVLSESVTCARLLLQIPTDTSMVDSSMLFR